MSGRGCKRVRLCGLAVALALAGFSSAPARAEGVALTFDDLPQLSLSDSPRYARRTNLRLLAGLERHNMPAVGFVIGDRVQGAPAMETAILKAWLKSGEGLGNHTYDHEALNDTPLPAYLASIARTDRVLHPLLAAQRQKTRWFRAPYLETGASEDVRDGLEAWLKRHHDRMAPVTLENSDWQFALPYDEAILHHDRLRAQEIRQAYIDYTAQIVPWYREAALDVFGRRPPLIFLLHASRINADTIDDLAAILRRNDLHATTLAHVMRDPAYASPEGAPDKEGDEWLRRWASVMDKPLPWATLPKVPADIVAANDRLDLEP